MTEASTLLATGFIADSPDEGTIFPSAGGNSGNPAVQAIYWRCIVVLFASARINNPSQPLALFTNVTPPTVDGISIGAMLDRYGVELRRVPLTNRLTRGAVASWGNVLYFFDILASLDNAPDSLGFALMDSDIVVTGPVAPLFSRLGNSDYVTYTVDTTPDYDVNGLSPRQMTQIALEAGAQNLPPIVPHYGGEVFCTTMAAWRRDRDVFLRLLHDAAEGAGPGAMLRTEEHIFSVALALLAANVAGTEGILKRIWTSPRFNTAMPGDELLPIWHLPAEKRYGLRDLFYDLSRLGFPTLMDADDFRKLAMRRCGVPAKTTGKIARDGVRQVAAKIGWRL